MTATTALLSGRLVRDAAFWIRCPPSPLREHGYEVIPDFLDDVECERLVDLANSHLADHSHVIDGEAYLVVRSDSPSGRDAKVRQLMNAHRLDDRLWRMYTSRVFEQPFSSRLGTDVVVDSITLQIDDPDTATKRDYHVDRFSPPTFKLFVYLSDVDGPQHGPYTVVPGSHREIAPKVASGWRNLRRGAPFTDASVGYDDSRAELLLGPRGTEILSCQAMAHKGWPQHTERTRYMLVTYLSLKKHASAEPFTLGRELTQGRLTPLADQHDAPGGQRRARRPRHAPRTGRP